MLWGGKSRTNQASASHHLQLDPERIKRYGMVRSVVNELYRVDGGLRVWFLDMSLVSESQSDRRRPLQAYYRGYLSSVATYVPTSALWWMFYPVYSDQLASSLPDNTSHMLIHCTAGSLSGMTVASKSHPPGLIPA